MSINNKAFHPIGCHLKNHKKSFFLAIVFDLHYLCGQL